MALAFSATDDVVDFHFGVAMAQQSAAYAANLGQSIKTVLVLGTQGGSVG